MKPNLIFQAALPLAGLALACLTSSLHAGSHTWSGLGVNGNFSDPQNWSSGGVPEGREANVILIFPASATDKNPNQNISNLGIDQIVIQGDGYVFSASAGANYFLRGGAAVDLNNGSANDTRFDESATLVLNDQVVLQGSSGSVLLEGAITGPGGMEIVGPTVEYAGNTINTYTGLTTVQNGTLRLNKAFGVGFAGDLQIGITLGANDNERVMLLRANQIPDAANVTILPTGWLNLNGFNDTLHDLTMTSARVSSGAGTLTLAGQIQVFDGGDSSVVQGRLNLGNANRSITVETNALLDIVGGITGGAGAGIDKHGVGALWLSASNSFSGPLHVHAGHVGLFDSWALGTVAGRTYVHAGAELETFGTTIVSGEGLNLNGHGPSGLGALKHTGLNDAIWKGSFVLESDASISVQTNRTYGLDGPISGPGGFAKVGPGKLELDGITANTYGGATFVNEGELVLVKPGNVVAIPGPLVIGDNLGRHQSDILTLTANGQIAPGAPVSVRGTGFFDVDSYSQIVGSLILHGSATVNVDVAGVLTLPGLVLFTGLDPVAAEGSPGLFVTTAIEGNGEVHLAGPTTFAAQWVNHLRIRVSGGATAHLSKTGTGSVGLERSNNYAGLTFVKEGDLSVAHTHALGSAAAGTIVTNSGVLVFADQHIQQEPLVLAGDNQNLSKSSLSTSGSNSWAGPITLITPSIIKANTALTPGWLRLSGPIGGGGQLIKTGEGALEIAGSAANLYSGGTLVNEGPLLLNKSGAVAIPGALTVGDGTNSAVADEVKLLQAGQIADSAPVTVGEFGTLNLNNLPEAIGSLEGHGDVATQFATLTTGANNFTTTFHGQIGGVGFTTLVKEGTGTMILTGDNSYSGRTLVNNGRLFVHGKLAGTTIVSAMATLGGNGSVGVVTNNGTINAGAGAGKLESKTVTFRPGSTLRAELNGATPGISYDQLVVTGAVNLVGCSLDASLGFAAGAGEQFVIIDNDGNDAVAGTFNFLPQNATFALGGQQFRITYSGGDGNDVVLMRANTPPSLPQLTATAFTNEGGIVHINGTISDPDAGDSFTFVVNWGDGSPQQTVNLPAGTQLFHVEHLYTDDKPGAQASDSFTINYTLTDASGSPAFGQLNTIIGNVAPQVFAGGAVSIPSGAALSSTLTFADPGSDTWTATVNYGDGSGTQPLTVGPGKSLPIEHTFPSNGVYTVTIEVTDDDSGKGSGTFDVLVGLQLSIAKRGATAVNVSWPEGFNGFTLQSSPVLPGTNWVNVAGAPALLNSQWVQTVPSTNAVEFFRLIKP